MRDGESTLNRKARREPTAKAERKLLPKNRTRCRGARGETTILATGGKVLPGTRFRGAHAGQR